jgi:ribulose-5-phosphate 4-epimerase/fuculose-1-phosphate aldolase
VCDEDYDGLASSEERVGPFADALRTRRAIMLPNHGAITTGPNIQAAIFSMLTLEGMCARHLSVAGAARATGLTPKPIAPEIAKQTKIELMTVITKHNAMEMVWSDLLTKLKQTDPDLFRHQSVHA